MSSVLIHRYSQQLNNRLPDITNGHNFGEKVCIMIPTPTADLIIPIQGMNCSGCAASVERAIRKITGVSRVRVDLVNNQAEIEYDPSQVGMPVLKSAGDRAGYSAPASQPSTFSTARFKKLTADWR